VGCWISELTPQDVKKLNFGHCWFVTLGGGLLDKWINTTRCQKIKFWALLVC